MRITGSLSEAETRCRDGADNHRDSSADPDKLKRAQFRPKPWPPGHRLYLCSVPPPPRIVDPRITEKRNPRSTNIDLASPLEIVDLIGAEDARVPDAVRSQREPIARAIEEAEATFRRGGRLFYVGAGTSGRLGVLDASEMPPTYGTDPEMVQGIIAGGHKALTRSQEGAEDRLESAVEDLSAHGVRNGDFVIGIAASGTTPYVRRALAYAREIGARTGLVACSPPPDETVRLVDILILPITGPEVVTDSPLMHAGEATTPV